MASITTRVDGTGQSGVTVKGSPLTNSEIDANFLSLNNNKLESSWTGNTTIVTLGTIATGTWSATTIAVNKGGTGQTSYTDGQLLIGNSTGNTLTKTTLTGTANQVIVTNGAGSITLSTPQSIGTSSNVQFNSIGVNATASGTAGEIRATNAITSYYSDARLKTFEGTIPDALAKVMSLNGYYFTENEVAKSLGYNNDARQVGVSAQEVEIVLPEVICQAPINDSFDGADYKTVQYEKLVPLLIESIKELKRELDMLKGAQ